ncbi:MAG: efflux RND transporter permease subunit [Methylotetracoccus sp.]|nr:efflux RND transporter permease subunit [Methylotetracoccus sp.]
MVLSDLSIRRPVLATVASLVLVLLGLMCFERLPVREYPDIDTSIVSIMTVYKGASAEVMESQVTRPLEDSLSGIEGIKTMKSVSREEVSRISVEFTLSRDPNSAAADVRDRVSRVRARLPEEIDEPVISKVEADAQPILWLAFFSDRHNALEITDVADRFVQDRLQTLPGVASVIIGGERRYAMRIWLDRDRMAAYGVTVADVENALLKRNLELPGGRIESLNRELTVFTETDLRTPEQFNDLIVRSVSGYPVRLADFGRAEIGAEDERNIVRVNGNPAVGMGVVKQATANTLEVARAIKDELPKLNESLPDGMGLKVSFDTSLFIEESIRAVYKTLLEALGLVLAITFLFLRSLRALLIPFVTIPVSLIGAFIFLYAFGFSVNILTLLALVLAIGLVVDDAIVMMENIYRRIENGMPPLAAAFDGSREIAFAVIAMTVTLAAVFTPLAFMTGNTGRLFSEFALAVSCAVLVSGFVALTLTPMMCSRLLRASGRTVDAEQMDGSASQSPVLRGFSSLLRRVIRYRLAVMAMMVVMAVATYRLFGALNSELSPLEDRGNVIAVVSAPEGSSLEYTDRYAAEIEQFLATIPEASSYFMVVAPGLERPNPVNSALAFLRLVPWAERTRTQQQIAAELLPKFMGLPGVLAFPINPPSLGQNFRNPPIQYVLQGPTYDELEPIVGKFIDRALAIPGIVNVDSDLKLDKPQLSVLVNREKAADVGVDVDEIGRTLQTLLGGRQVTRFKREGEQYDVIVKLADSERATPGDVMSLYLRSERGGLVQLANVVDLRERASARELNHFNRLRAATVSANLAPGYTLGQALAALDRVAGELLPPSFKTDLDGQSREFQESSRTLYLTFLFALIFIYLVLAAQFESFLDPLIIMLSVPLAVLGALLALKLTGGTLNVYSQIGLVMLVGLITKNGILIVEFANQLRVSGLSPSEAALQASVLRLRPILMTSLTMILGALPLALAADAGAESRQQIGWVIVGGMTIGTFLTIFVIPSVYVSFSTIQRRGWMSTADTLDGNF